MGKSRAPDPGPLGTLLRNYRGGRTVESVAEQSGVSRHTIYRWERGEISDPNRTQFHAVLDALGVPREDAYRALGILPPDPDHTSAEHLSDPDEQALWNLGVKRDWDEPTRMHLIFALRARRMDTTDRTLVQERIRASIAERADDDGDSSLASRDEPA